MWDPYEDLSIHEGWTRPVTHIAPQCLNPSYWRTQVFEHCWTETGVQFLFVQIQSHVRQ